MSIITNLNDLKRIYKSKTPRMFYDYVEGASWTESTKHANEEDFQKIKLRQRVAVDIHKRTLSTKILGQEVTMPVVLGPVGLTGMQCANGEIKAAKAAEEYGIPYALSTMSICSIEDVAEATTAPFWFQLYMIKDQEFNKNTIDRAKAAGCSTLIITLDAQEEGNRFKDKINGLSVPPQIRLGSALNLMTKWSWGLKMLRAKSLTFGNIMGHAKGVHNNNDLVKWMKREFDRTVNWTKVAEVSEHWGGKVIIKGILNAHDAKKAVDAGADAIVVSNHGGRQLDGVLSTIRVLPSIVEAVGDKTEVYIDSGVRTGHDILKAIALGARGVFIGRAYIYGLGADGQRGVKNVLDLLYDELDKVLAMSGTPNINDVDKRNLVIPKDFFNEYEYNE